MSERPTTMPAISLWQPWASFIAYGYKLIETRGHARFRCLAGKRIAIHAAERLDPWAIRTVALAISDARRKELGPQFFVVDRWRCAPLGAIVCTATVAEFRRLTAADNDAALCDCSGGDRWGLVLAGIAKWDVPLPCVGRRGVFKVAV